MRAILCIVPLALLGCGEPNPNYKPVSDGGGCARVFYPDDDGDGYGAMEGGVEACKVPPGYTETPGDCADGDPRANPGQQGYFKDPVKGAVPSHFDYNCNGQEDRQLNVDADCEWPTCSGNNLGGWSKGQEIKCGEIALTVISCKKRPSLPRMCFATKRKKTVLCR